jgi:hypothetical protein
MVVSNGKDPQQQSHLRFQEDSMTVVFFNALKVSENYQR